MKNFLPILKWLPQYKRKHLLGDLSAGLTVGVMLIPQGMAYAMIAGLPPVYGLYASMIPQIIYAFFGTSRQLAVGPVAMDSLLVAAGIATIASSGTQHYITLAIFLALMMGAILLLFGTLRLGFIVNFLSKPVISGFTTAAAFIIGATQLKHLLGIELESTNNTTGLVYDIFTKSPLIHWPTLFIGIGAIITLLVAKKIHRLIPGALISVFLGILIMNFTDLSKKGVKVIGAIPEGLPDFSIPSISTADFQSLIPIAFTLSLIAFMEAISIAKALQTKHKNEYTLDNNQEMIALGMSNIIGSLFGSYPTTGGFGRSAVNDQSGAKTNLSALISALLVGLVLFSFTHLFQNLPKAILGAIIVVAVAGLVDFRYPKFLFKTNKEDFFMLLITFIITIGVGIKEGILAGVLMSLAAMIYRSTKPHIAVLGRLPNTRDYRNISRFKKIEVREDVLIIRHDAQLYFANIDNFVDTTKNEVSKKGDSLKLFVLHCGSISYIDATALQALKELVQDLHESGVYVTFSGLIGPVRDFFHKTGFIKEMGEKHFFTDVQSAIDCMDNGDASLSKKSFKRALQTNIFKEKEI